MEKSGKIRTFSIRIPDHCFEIFNNNSSRIDILIHPPPERVVKFYMFARSMASDLKSYQQHVKNGLTLEEAKWHANYFEDQIGKTLKLGNEIIEDIPKIYSSK